MELQGRLLPQVVFKTRVRDESIGGDNPYRWEDKTTDDLFENKGGRGVVFSLPGRIHNLRVQHTKYLALKKLMNALSLFMWMMFIVYQSMMHL